MSKISNNLSPLKLYGLVGKILTGMAGAIIGFLYYGYAVAVLGFFIGLVLGSILEKLIVAPSEKK